MGEADNGDGGLSQSFEESQTEGSWIRFYERTSKLPISLDDKKKRLTGYYEDLSEEEKEIIGDLKSYLSNIEIEHEHNSKN